MFSLLTFRSSELLDSVVFWAILVLISHLSPAGLLLYEQEVVLHALFSFPAGATGPPSTAPLPPNVPWSWSCSCTKLPLSPEQLCLPSGDCSS